MTVGKFLLDTNVAIPFLANDEGVLKRFDSSIEVFVPSVVIGELFYGAYKSARASENIKKVSEFALSMRILPCDLHTGRKYGEVKAVLQNLGKPIPENDLWISALALQHNLVLATRDEHFSFIPGLLCDRWQADSHSP